MKSFHCVSFPRDQNSGSWIHTLCIAALFICGVYFAGNVFLAKDYRILPSWKMNDMRLRMQSIECNKLSFEAEVSDTMQNTFGREMNHIKQKTLGGEMSHTRQETLGEEMNDYGKNILGGGINDTGKEKQFNKCKNQCRLVGSEALPEGIIAKTSDLKMRPLWGPIAENRNSKASVSLLAVSVGIKQKETVKEIVKKFLDDGFVVMLFHYDNVVDEWRDLGWSSRVIHVSAMNQTKWWFAKRFLHPDIVAEYDYIFLWDEDLGVEDFHPARYLSIVKDEGLEISQPALDPNKSEWHHQITARLMKSKVHRRIYKLRGNGICNAHSTAPPCTGWVEMMAPVFSRAAWRCVWYMIQNDLIHAWGIDKQLGYCAQGDRTKNVGVVDSEYIVHLGFPTLGVSEGKKKPSRLRKNDGRLDVRRRSFYEMHIFEKRWNNSAEEDKCWVDPYQQPGKLRSH